MKILLMEDDPVLGDIVQDYLLQFYIAHRAFESAEAQEFIDDESYDLISMCLEKAG